MKIEIEKPQRSSQFTIREFLLLTAGCAYALAMLAPVASRLRFHPILLVAALAALTVTGFAISYPIWRFLLRKRFTVVAANHLAYALPWIVLGIVWDDEVFQILLELLKGPFAYCGVASPLRGTFPLLGQPLLGFCIMCFLAAPMIMLMWAHPFRQNLMGAILTSLGTALWYVVAFCSLLARMA